MTFGLLAVVGLVILVLAVAAVLLLRLARPPHPTPEQIVRGVGRLAGELGKVFPALAREIRPGVTTLQLEQRLEHCCGLATSRDTSRGTAVTPRSSRRRSTTRSPTPCPRRGCSRTGISSSCRWG
jgi:hypothetical protein